MTAAVTPPLPLPEKIASLKAKIAACRSQTVRSLVGGEIVFPGKEVLCSGGTYMCSVCRLVVRLCGLYMKPNTN
jgi:hypothetical protein